MGGYELAQKVAVVIEAARAWAARYDLNGTDAGITWMRTPYPEEGILRTAIAELELVNASHGTDV